MNDDPDTLDIALGERIRIRRRQLKLSQEELGARINVSFQQVQKYECGANRISFSTLVRIAHTLKCRVSDLVGEIDGHAAEPPTVAMLAPNLPGNEVHELLSAYANIKTKGLRRSIINLAHALATRSTKDGS